MELFINVHDQTTETPKCFQKVRNFGFNILFHLNQLCQINCYYSVISLHLRSSTGNYHESLSDSKRATELQPTYLKAIVGGKH